MGQRIVVVYEPGELVKWYERYADGFMVKDAGSGVVLHKRVFELGYSDGPYVNYEVYRTKHMDKMIFSEEELERIINE